jgi:hypothetical protein
MAANSVRSVRAVCRGDNVTIVPNVDGLSLDHEILLVNEGRRR